MLSTFCFLLLLLLCAPFFLSPTTLPADASPATLSIDASPAILPIAVPLVTLPDAAPPITLHVVVSPATLPVVEIKARDHLKLISLSTSPLDTLARRLEWC